MTHYPTLLEQLTKECHEKLMSYEYMVIARRLMEILKDKHWITELTIADAQDLIEVMEDEPFPKFDVAKLYSYINK